jgi:hypothetical protein
MKNIISLSVALFLTVTSFPQQQSNWQNYADMKSAKDIVTTSAGVWTAAQGGAYFYNTSDSTFKTHCRVFGKCGRVRS